MTTPELVHTGARVVCLSILLAVITISPNAAAAVCTLRASTIDFGSYNPVRAAPTLSVGTIIYRCLSVPPAGIKILLAGTQLGTTGLRNMTTGSGESLPYLLCLDPRCLQPWGDGSNGTAVYYDPKPPVGAEVTINVFGLVLGRQSAKPNRVYGSSVAVVAEF